MGHRELQYRNQTEELGPSAAWRSIRSKLAHDLVGGDRPWFDLGAGLNFELDTAQLDVKVPAYTCTCACSHDV